MYQKGKNGDSKVRKIKRQGMTFSENDHIIINSSPYEIHIYP